MAFSPTYAKDGLGTNIKFNNLAEDLWFTEVKMKPPGWSKRGGIDITSLRNVAVTTKLQKTLAESNDMSLVVMANTGLMGFAPGALIGLIGVNQLIFVRYPPNLLGLKALYQVYGWCDKLEPHEFAEGELPLYDMTVIVSNTDNFGVETPPALVGYF